MQKKKNSKKYIGKIADFLHKNSNFLLQIAINTFYNLNYDYWDLITKF